MAKAKKGDVGAPAWIVTFADLMSLLVCFFVLIISFSIQDKEKLQIVAGSMREAFGVKPDSRRSGFIEIEGEPVRPYVRSVAVVNTDADSDFSQIRHDQRRKQGPEANTHEYMKADIEKPRNFALAAASLRQSWAEMPDITALSENIIVEEQPDGLNLQLVDQEGRSMFPSGEVEPHERTRELLTHIGPALAKMPNRIKITGHTDSTRLYARDGYTLWDLSSDRANAVRRILARHGVPDDQFYAVSGRADTEPLFPDDTFLAANRRISILIMAEDPPLPPGYAP
ncbi:MAG: flagellar motor protein MotB [Rhizobiales bacterium]|nr:flagellar motor protein MotB [Hyphomicrobiales bacterium]